MPVTSHRYRFLKMLVELFLCDFINLRSVCPGKAVEERVYAAVPFHFGYVVVLGEKPVQFEYLRGCTHRYSHIPIREGGNAEVMLPVLRASVPYKVLPGLSVMAHSNVPAVFLIDSLHYTAESLTVNRGVAKIAVSDVIVNHLVNDDILQFLL